MLGRSGQAAIVLVRMRNKPRRWLAVSDFCVPILMIGSAPAREQGVLGDGDLREGIGQKGRRHGVHPGWITGLFPLQHGRSGRRWMSAWAPISSLDVSGADLLYATAESGFGFIRPGPLLVRNAHRNRKDSHSFGRATISRSFFLIFHSRLSPRISCTIQPLASWFIARGWPDRSWPKSALNICRTVQEMDKVMEELKVVIAYRDKCAAKGQLSSPISFVLIISVPSILAVCLSSRRNMCIHPSGSIPSKFSTSAKLSY
jgi:hypothetical protein